MTAAEWIARHVEGLGLLFAFTRDLATALLAVEAFLEVCRLGMERE
jgi:hypothetical protein